MNILSGPVLLLFVCCCFCIEYKVVIFKMIVVNRYRHTVLFDGSLICLIILLINSSGKLPPLLFVMNVEFLPVCFACFHVGMSSEYMALLL